MKSLPKLIFAIAICQLTGIIGSVFTINSIPTWYAHLNKPSFSPPNWIFGPVWTLLYLLMGISVYLIWSKGLKKKSIKSALKLFLVQLALNFIWTPIFFGLRSLEFGLIVIVAMWIYIFLTIKSFYLISKLAAYLLIPYLLWVSFATILNASLVLLN